MHTEFGNKNAQIWFMNSQRRTLAASQRSSQVGFAEFNNTADNRANIGGTIIGAPIVGQ